MTLHLEFISKRVFVRMRERKAYNTLHVQTNSLNEFSGSIKCVHFF